MKRIFIILLTILLLAVSACQHEDIWNELRDHKQRIEQLEKLCRELNSNVEAIQTVLAALQQNDYVTEVMKIMEDGMEVGYSLTFAKGGIVNIYHGTDGKDVSDGTAPNIGVKKANDGAYYWTSDGEWMTGEDGEMIPATVTDPDGNYIVPQFRVADGVWYVSYDNGNSWRQIEEAEQKENEQFFQNIDVSNADYVIFSLTDGTEVKIPKYNKSKSYWYGKKMVCTGSSIPAGSGLASKTDAFPYLVAEELGMSLVNYSIGGTVIAKRSGDYDECYYDNGRWEYDKNNGLLDKSKKYLVNTGKNNSKWYEIFSYNGSGWVSNGTTSDQSGRYPLSDRVGEMDDDADVIMIMSGSNDFYYNWNPFGDFEDGKYRNSGYTDPSEDETHINTDINLIESKGVEFFQYGGPSSTGSALVDNHDYFGYNKIPVKGNHAVKVPYGRNGWWLDKEMNDISLINFTNNVENFTAIAPENAAYLIVCFKYTEITPEACVAYQSVESVVPTFGEENLLVEHDVELIEECAPTANSSTVDYTKTAYFTYRLIPVTGGRAVKVPYGRNAWWIDEEMKDISLVNFTLGSDDFTHIAPANAKYMTVCFKYEEVAPEDCVVYMSTSAPGGPYAKYEGRSSDEPNETFNDGLHKLCRALLKKYKNKDIIFLTPIKRVQETHWSCIYPEDANKYGKTLVDYRNAIIECCEYYSIQYVDLYTLSGLNPHIDASLFADTDGRAVHPNEEGHRKIASTIIAQMESTRR